MPIPPLHAPRLEPDHDDDGRDEGTRWLKIIRVCVAVGFIAGAIWFFTHADKEKLYRQAEDTVNSVNAFDAWIAPGVTLFIDLFFQGR